MDSVVCSRRANVKSRSFGTLPLTGFLIAASLLAPKCLNAQAPPGPITAPSQDPPPRLTTRSSQSSRTNAPQVAPRTTLAGAWHFNRNDSDDPLQIVRTAEHRTDNSNYPGGGYPGGGYPGGGYPGGGYPGGGYPSGSPFPRQGGSNGGPRNNGGDIEDNPKMQPLLHPSTSLGFDLKDAEVDVTDDHLNRLILYTDGRQLQKTTYNNREEVAGHWSGSELVSDEKSPLGGKMSRTFELSQDGRKFYETLHIDNGRSKSPIVIRYVYDATGSDAPVSEAPDPDRPVLKRTSDVGSSDSPPPDQASDPGRPTLKRNADDTGASQ
jgi:hypothetical protein